MLFELPTERTLEQIDEALRASAAKHSFGIIAVHDLQATMRNKGVEFNRPVLVYEVCNPHQAKKVLEENGAVSTALPCRISVYGDQGVNRIATLLPTEMMKAFGNPGLDPVAREVEQVLVEMIRDAAGSLRTIDPGARMA